MSLARILIQLDPDAHASVFDAVVAIDADVDQLLQYANVEPSAVRGLVHGAMFTRGPADLKSTAIFIGGSSVSKGEALLSEVKKAYFGPVRCSVMFDGNGSNTTAVAAVLSASKHCSLSDSSCLVLGGTGPVGSRVARLLAGEGAQVWLASRDLNKAQAACDEIAARLPESSKGKLTACSQSDLGSALAAANVLISCGAAGTQLIHQTQLESATALQVAIDLNAVPPKALQVSESWTRQSLVERG